MHAPLSLLALPLLPLAALASTATLYAWPLAAPSPTPLATINYSVSPANASATVASYTAARVPAPVPADDAAAALIRVGLYDAASKRWTGVATAARSFAPGVRRRVRLFVDGEGEAWGVGFAAGGAGGEAEDEGEEGAGMQVQVVRARKGPRPALDRPVAPGADGRAEEKEEKTFLQK